MRRAWGRSLSGGMLAFVVLILVPVVASAHPLGNFTVNQYSGIVVRADGVDVDFVLDVAEIPTAQLLSQLGGDESQLLARSAADQYRHSECDRIRGAITLRSDNVVSTLQVTSSDLGFPSGVAGLHTLRLSCRFSTAGSGSPAGHTLTYTSRYLDDRVGWREITAVGTSSRLIASDVPTSSVSARLTSYPSDLLASPLDVRAAALTVVAGTGGAEPTGTIAGPAGVPQRGLDQFTSTFVGLVSRQDVTALFALAALGFALVLGGIHAFAPGHGKTLMAAYLVGQRGSLRHAAALAGSVTVTHTIGVLALGIALSLSTSFAPIQLYPFLGVASGLIIVIIGLSLLIRAWRTRTARAEHDHVHGGNDGRSASSGRQHVTVHAEPTVPSQAEGDSAVHRHSGQAHSHVPGTKEAPRLRSVLAIGFAGGMVPSPSALVVLIGGIALHRTWFAVLLVIAYGVGMALVLTGTGVALRHARTLIDRRLATRRSMPGGALLTRVATSIPLLTAAAVVMVGLGLTLRGAGAL